MQRLAYLCWCAAALQPPRYVVVYRGAHGGFRVPEFDAARAAQYGDHLDRARCSAMAQYWPSLSGAQRCACVGGGASAPEKKKACVELFARRHWENPDGSASRAFAATAAEAGDGYFENMTGPPATAGVYRFTNGAELFFATNHPLMNSKAFGLDSVASALGVDLRTVDAVYLNPGNYEGFGELFCGGRVDPEVVRRDGAELPEAAVRASLERAGFRGKLLLTGRKAEDDVSVLFRDAVAASARGETPFPLGGREDIQKGIYWGPNNLSLIHI